MSMEGNMEAFSLKKENNKIEDIDLRLKHILSSNEEQSGRLFVDFWWQIRFEPGSENKDFVFKEIVSLAKTDPHRANKFIYLMGSDLEYISPEIVQDSLLEIEEIKEEEEDADEYDSNEYVDVLSERLLSAAVYNVKYKKDYTEKLINQIEFSKPENFNRSVKSLDFLWQVLAKSHYESYAESNVNEIVDAIKKESLKPETSYFLKKYTEIILDTIRTRVSPQVLNMMIDPHHTPKEVEEKDILLTTKKDPEQIKRQIKDFKLISSPVFRNQLEKDVGFKINSISIPEQFELLSFLQTAPQNKIPQVKSFNEKFGTSGFRSFLSLEHGGREMGDKILDLANILPERDTQDIFEGYSEMLNTASHLKDRIKNAPNNELNNEFKNKLAEEISEAVIWRAKDILLSAHHVASQKTEKFNVSDVRNSLDGITKVLSIIGDLGEGKEYNFSTLQENEFGRKFSVLEKGTNQIYELKTFVRPRAEKNAQARINFELNFDTKFPNRALKDAFHNMIISHKQNKVIEGSVLRVGIDREDFKGEPKLSLDFGRSERDDEEMTRTGDVLGNLLSETDKEGHHTTGTFSPEFAEEENFSKVAGLFLKYIKDQKN